MSYNLKKIQMKISLYKLLAILLVLNISSLKAQKKSFKEEFKVKSDVVIDINTRHSDIEIETWNKNKVVVEAYMMVEGEEITEKMRDNFYKKWDFKAYGNSDKVTVKSRTNSVINVQSFDFENPDYTLVLSDLSDHSIGSLDVLDSIDFIVPELPEIINVPMPPAPPAPPLPQMKVYTKFDYDAYKKDKNYLKRWKEKNKKALGKNAKVKIGDKSISIVSDESEITMSGLEDLRILFDEREEIEKERKEQMKESRKEWKEKVRQEMKKARKELKKVREKLKKQYEKQRKERKKIQKVLKDRSKLKVKRFIKIKAPKNAKFNMNVKYGALTFSK